MAAAAEVNGTSALVREEEEPMEVTAEGEHTENYQTLIDAGLPQKVAESLDNVFSTGGESVIQSVFQRSVMILLEVP